MYQVNLVTDYCKNVEEIIELAEQQLDDFSSREENSRYEFHTSYGKSKLKSLFHFNMNPELKDAIFKTIPEDRRFVTSYTINRYEPGDYLPKHKDSIGGYWKFKLVFLRSDKPHFKWYDNEGSGHLVEEVPGAYLEMPIDIVHEVTEIEPDEQPKYSLVLAWGEGR